MVDIAEKVRAAAGIGVDDESDGKADIDLVDVDDLPITLD